MIEMKYCINSYTLQEGRVVLACIDFQRLLSTDLSDTFFPATECGPTFKASVMQSQKNRFQALLELSISKQEEMKR